MESKDSSSKAKEQEKLILINSNNNLRYIKSNFILKISFNYMTERKALEILKYNKNIQKRINININHYKDYYEKIEIEIIPIKNKYGPFININEKDKKYYHIYFNDNKREEIKSTYLNEENKISKINIIIDYQVTLFSFLFYNCDYIKSIDFKKFFRNNITNMNDIFSRCWSSKELKLSYYNTNNVTDMNCMFGQC